MDAAASVDEEASHTPVLVSDSGRGPCRNSDDDAVLDDREDDVHGGEEVRFKCAATAVDGESTR